MAQLFNMPQLGSTMEEGLVALWKRREGEAIQKGDILLEVETDKTIVEVPAPCDGVLRKILAQPETRVLVHQPIAILGVEHEDIAPLLAGLSAESAGQKADGEPPTVGRTAAIPEMAEFAISPRARRLADEQAVPLTRLAGRGTGPGGRVIERDVLAYLEEQDKQIDDLSELALGLPGSQVRPMTASLSSSPAHIPRGGPASASALAQQTPIVGGVASMTLEVDMTACLDLRAQLLAAVNKTYGVVLDCLHLVVKATARALANYPQLNAPMMGDGPESADQSAIALLTPVESELVTQVVVNANTRTLGAVSAALTGFTDRPSMRAVDRTQSSFTLVALTDEVDRFYADLPPGHVAALGLGRIAQRPLVSHGQVVARTTMHLCLTYAPASVDTALAARFLQQLRDLLETPAQILI